MNWKKPRSEVAAPKYPGVRTASDGSEAIVSVETAASEGAGAYPITPSTQMGEGWAAAVAAGTLNVNGRRLIFFEPEGEHAAAAVTAGMSMTGLRAANFSSGQGIAYMHESLYPAVGKRLTYVLNVACRAMTKHALNVHAGHDDYHAIDDTGFFQVFAKNVQEAADLNLIAHRIAELSLNPGVCAQDGFLTSHVIESLLLPERALVKEYLGDPADIIDSPTAAQRMVFGDTRRRIPEMFDLDYPTMLGVVQNQDSYAQGVAAQRPFYFDHIKELAEQAMEEYFQLTGRRYLRASGYRLEDADYVIAGQGSMVWNAEAVADYLRQTRGLAIGVLNVTMFRPFPADRLTELLRGKKAVTVLERTDQPLAVDLPLAREIRAAMSKAVENGRARNGKLPHPTLASIAATEVPEIYSGVFGLGSRDLQPGDLVAAAENMLPKGSGKRQFYLGLDFIREGTRLPKLQIWQERLIESYPDVSGLALPSAGDINLMPEDSVSLRIHSVGGWGAITMGKNLAMTAFELLGWHIKANPKYGSEKKGQPTTFYGTLAKDPIRLNSELKHVDVVLSPDPNVMRHSNPLHGLADGGVFVIQTSLDPVAFWESLPPWARREIEERKIRVYLVDAFRIASDEASEADLRYRMQGTAFMGSFFRVAGLMEKERLDEKTLFDGIRKQVEKKFGHLGERVVEDNVRVIRRGFDEVELLEHETSRDDEGAEPGRTPHMPDVLDGRGWREGIGNPGRFWEQVAYLYKSGDEPIADPFAAISAIPAATSTIRDMTDVRFEVPEFVADKCTGCSQCWVVCPDAAIPGVVNTVEELIDAAIATNAKSGSFDKLRQLRKPLAAECRRIMKGVPFHRFGDVLSQAYKAVVGRLDWAAERRAQLDDEFAPVFSGLSEFPLAKTQAFFDLPESREKGSGGLLSVTVNPEACKGCNLCVEVCPDQALITVQQDQDVVDTLRRNWKLWEHLPDTDDRYVNVTDIDEGIGVLSSLLLKKDNYRTMFGGDGACMGCGEKTGVHLLLSALTAVMQPRVDQHVKRLEELIAKLDAKARGLLASDADLDAVSAEGGTVDIALEDSKREDVRRIVTMKKDLEELRWRYVEGPSGKGRALTGFSNSTGCSSVWGSTYPYNPYPFPWTNHLFQDAPSIAIGLFEGHMRKMADGFIAVRRAELELSGDYDPETDEAFFTKFDWRQFDDDEFRLCPPIFAVGGDGAMLDIGFQNASRLMASGKPIRIVVLDTQVYSNTGGQACTSGFIGQVSDMAAFGKAQHGKEETRKEMALIAMAHRGTFVLQSSQALPSHMLSGIIRGLNSRRPSVFILHCPCPPEHGLADNQSTHAAKLSLESRAFPFLLYDPDAGDTLADCIDLDGNPSPEDTWPTYELKYRDPEGNEQTMELPLTIADWAATEVRFKKHFKPVADDAEEELVPFHEYLELSQDERADQVPFIYSIDANRHLRRASVSKEIVKLAEERLQLWHELREMAGQENRGVDEAELEAELEQKLQALRVEYEGKLADLRARFPQFVARRMAEGLLRAGNGGVTVADLLAKAESTPALQPLSLDASGLGLAGALEPSAGGRSTVAEPAPPAAPLPAAPAPAPAAVVEEDEAEEGLTMEPYVESARCTTCHECTNLNKKMFAYNEKKQAYIQDAKAGTFKELVMAAERCPVRIIHPGTPLNPKEKDLEKWIKRAEPFQ